jgi:hypothetical protein
MRRLIDLDAAAEEVEARRARWERDGFSVGPLTWRDGAAPWPQTIGKDRSVVADPDSVGVTIKRGGVEAAVVLFRGGWADVEAALVGGPEDPVLDAPELADVSAFGQLLDDVFEQLRRLAGLDGPKSGPTSSS